MEKPILYTSTSTVEHDLLCEKYQDMKHKSPEYNRIMPKTPDEALRPSHYGGEGNVFEVFNVLEAWELDKDFYLGNVVKYVARAGKKNKSKEKEDLQKALVYLQKRIDLL